MDRAVLVAAERPPSATLEPPHAAPQSACDPQAQALALALERAQDWAPQILTLALASLGDIDLPDPHLPPRGAAVLSALPALYWVYGLDQAGLLKAADTVAGLWASGAIQVPLPDRGQALQNYWRSRRERLSADERAHLLGLVFDPRDFEPAMQRLCTALLALADNAGQHDIREEVGLQHAAAAVLELCTSRLEGVALLSAPDLLAQTRAAVQLLSARALQTAFAVRDFYGLIELSDRASGAPLGGARRLAERAQAGAAVLRWLAQSGAQGFGVDPHSGLLPGLLADAQRWLLSTPSSASTARPGHESLRFDTAAA